LLGGKSKSKKSQPVEEGNDTAIDPTSATSDSDNGSVSENASVNSERFYGNKIKNILLQADDAEVLYIFLSSVILFLMVSFFRLDCCG
jgi:hypothetical protein